MASGNGACGSSGCGCGGNNDGGNSGGQASRRDFLKLGAAVAAGAAIAPPIGPAFAGPFEPADVADHFIPVDKKLKPEWVKSLFVRGQKQVYSGDDLRMIGMPVGGITTGQVYVSGDGRLTYWGIFNQQDFTGYGDKNYSAGPPSSPIQQGFTVRVTGADGKPMERPLDRSGFPGVTFCGEYPIAWVDYVDREFPVSVRLEAFSPFCPLSEDDSSLPVTVLRYTLKNTSDKPLDVRLTGLLENAVARFSQVAHSGVRENGMWDVDNVAIMTVSSAKATAPQAAPRKPIVIETFEGENYGNWTAEGEAFGKGPARGAFEKQQAVSGFQGKGLVNTFIGGSDRAHGKLTSPPIKLERNFVCFLIGGGEHAGKTCINLLVEGKAVRTMVGQNKEKLEWRSWDVREFAGKEARLEIVDAESGPWGHINIDQIELRDVPPGPFGGPFEKQPDFGTMGLAVMKVKDRIDDATHGFITTTVAGREASASVPLSEKLVGGVWASIKLASGQSYTFTFMAAWHFPNRADRGNRYATRFPNAPEVVHYVSMNFDRLYQQTLLWHKTWYEDSTLPRWLLDRLFSTVSTLATGTCQWWANGRFWAWEGVGCCHGTCAHVWNYAHSMARLFPALERSVRTMQDLEPSSGFDEKTGAVKFRGEGWAQWAGDSQGGTAMKCLREHQQSADDTFLKQNWPRIKKTIGFLIDQDADGDGLIEGKQHNTYDIDFYGANTMVGSLYLGALLAGEEMAKEVGDGEFAATCRRIFEAGQKNTIDRLWNGEYFIQQVDLAKHPKHQYGPGCLADHLFGQGWAHQVALGYVYPREKVLSALKAIWVYNWAPDVGPQNAKHPPQRWFARPGEAGLFTCTWPKSKHLGKDSVLYRDEIWTGIEYQVAGHMVWEGMVTEALAICRAVHERYHPARHNPWNEIECGDHYARGMASHGVFLALCGFEYHGPRGHIGFAPKITPENFAGAFTAAQGWGSFSQQIEGGAQTARLVLRWGKLRLRTIALGLAGDFKPAKVAVTLKGEPIEAVLEIAGGKALIRLGADVTIEPGATLQVTLR